MEYNAELVWSGVSECTELPIGQFTDKINKVLIISQSGAGASYSDPSLANLGIGFSNLECGSAYLALIFPGSNFSESDLETQTGALGISDLENRSQSGKPLKIGDAEPLAILTFEIIAGSLTRLGMCPELRDSFRTDGQT